MSNKLLFVVFVAIFATAYWFEERNPQQAELERQRKISFFDYSPKDLQAIDLPHIRIKRQTESFVDAENDWKISTEVVGLLFDKLSHLKVKRVIESGDKNYARFIPSDAPKVVFRFTQGEVAFSLGHKLSVDESFYVLLEKDKKRDLLQVFDSSILEAVYKPENKHNSDKKYLRIKSLLNIPRKFFWDKGLRQQNFKISRLFLENQRNRAFSVYFDEKRTQPKKLEGVLYNFSFLEGLKQELQSIQADNLHFKPDFSQLKNKLSSLSLVASDNNAENWELYNGYKQRTGYFVKTANQQVLYELRSDMARLFFLNVQDFWDKKVLTEGHPLTQTEQPFAIKFEDVKSLKVSLPVTEEFNIKLHGEDGQKFVPNFESWKSLFSILTGIGEWQQAHRVSSINQNELEKLKRWPQFELNFKNLNLRILHKGDELLVYNLTKGLKLHYLIGKQGPFGFKMRDFFYAK